ncbi:hypothetical protein Tco_0993955 [Tanacetum coccineum]
MKVSVRHWKWLKNLKNVKIKGGKERTHPFSVGKTGSNSYAAIITKMIADIEDRHHGPIDIENGGKDILKMEMEMEIPCVKASANSDVMYSFTSAQDGNPLQDDVRLCLGDDLKKAQDHCQRQA